MPISEYETAAQAWATKYGVSMTATFTGHRRYFADDKDTRDTYRIRLSRGDRAMEFDYGASLVDSKLRPESDGPYWHRVRHPKGEPPTYGKGPNLRAVPPTMYYIVTCLEKGEVGTFEQWAGDYGYDTDSRKALDTFLAVQTQAADFLRLCAGDSAMLAEAQDIA